MKKTLLLLGGLLAGLTSVPAALAGESVDHGAVFKESFRWLLTHETDKLLSLAREFDESQMEWAPMDGVFTTRAVLLHVAQANYGIGSVLGASLPEGMSPRNLVAETKAEALAHLENSIAFVQEAVANVDPADLATEVDFFGQKMPKMQVAMVLVGHNLEHLGQTIAYARSNDIVPPWSRPRAD